MSRHFRGKLLIALRTRISVSFPSEISDTSNLSKDCQPTFSTEHKTLLNQLNSKQ